MLLRSEPIDRGPEEGDEDDDEDDGTWGRWWEVDGLRSDTYLSRMGLSRMGSHRS